MFFGERWYGFDDAMYTAAGCSRSSSRSDDPSAVLDALPTSFNTPELNVPCAEGEHHAVVAELLARAGRRPAAFDGGEVGTIDGLRVDFADGFGLIRASNTTPVLVLRFEGHTARGAAAHRGAVHGRAAQRQARRAGGAGRRIDTPCCAAWRAAHYALAAAAGRRRCYLLRRGCGGAGAREPLYRQRSDERLGGLRCAPATPGARSGCTRCRSAKRAPRRR